MNQANKINRQIEGDRMNHLCFARIVKTLTVVAGLALAPESGASIITGSAVGSFSNVLDGNASGQYWLSNNDTGGIATLEWGVASSKSLWRQNCFTFNGTGSNTGSPLGSTTLDNLFSLGTFTYYNAMTRQDKVYGTDFTIDMNITGYGHAALLFHMLIDNTNDNSDPIASADTVSIANMADFANPFQFTVAGQLYDFQLMGFSRDGGQTFESTATSLENSGTTAEIYGRITAVSAVPLPAAAWLFVSGIAGLLAVARRKRGSVQG
jgi:hypothetical protein